MPKKNCLSSLANRGIFIKKNLNFYLTPVQVSNVNQTAYEKCWRSGESDSSFTADEMGL